MSGEPGANVLGFAAEYEEPGSEEKPPPRHARRRVYIRRIMALLSTGLVVSVGLCTYLWIELDAERADRASMAATNEASASTLDDTRQRLAETQDSLSAADDKLASSQAAVSKLERQLDKAKKNVAELESDLDTAKSDLAGSRSELEDLKANIRQSIDLLQSCTFATRQVAAVLSGGRFDREALAHEAWQAAQLCASASDSIPSP